MVTNILNNINTVTALIACIFLIPVLFGILRPFTKERVRDSVVSLFNNIILLAAIVLSVYLTRLLLSDSRNAVLLKLYEFFPELQAAVQQKSVWVYVLSMGVLTLAIGGILDLIAIPVYKAVVSPLSDRLSASVQSMNKTARQTLGGLWQLPRAVWLVLVFALLLNFYTESFSNPRIAQDANNSAPYQLVQENVIQPLLKNSVVKNIQVLLNDSFNKAKNNLTDLATKGKLTQYFNGVTLDEAIKSNAEIDAAAKKIVGTTKDDRKKAQLIYKWISRNVKYDTDKAAAIAANTTGVSSGAVVAYRTRTGICFDYACLYVAMCRAVGLKVRFVTGLGYTGAAWGDHAWNQVYDPNEGRWINVDTTFGSTGIDYFDRPSFDTDHADAVVQGEW